MTRKVLLSIAPLHIAAILEGRKRWEFRRVTVTICPGDEALIYATKPVSTVVARFTVGRVVTGLPRALVALEADRTQREAAAGYLTGARTATAIEVLNPGKLPHPIHLRSLGVNHPPMSYRFLS